MEIFLLRHGHAVMHAPTDAERPLSDQGRAEVRSTLTQSAERLAKLDAVWVSPYLRAQQTWQEASAFIADAPQSIQQPAITPEGRSCDVMALIDNAGIQRILLVTHQPFVGDFVDALTGAAPGLHSMGTANLAALQLDEGMPVAAGLAELQWLQRP